MEIIWYRPAAHIWAISEISMWVKVMWVERWNGEPSLRTIRLFSRITISICLPLVFVRGEPHKGLHEFRSPRSIVDPLRFCRISDMSEDEKIWLGGMYGLTILITCSNLSCNAEQSMLELMLRYVCGTFLLIRTPMPCLAEVKVGFLQKYNIGCVVFYK